MKKFMIMLLFCTVGLLQLYAQEPKQKNNPDKQITVNKKYDENGNLVQYDSTYVQQWSSDSTLNFPFSTDNFGFENLPEMLDYSAVNSILQQLGIADNFNFTPLNDEDFFEQFNGAFPDSLLKDHFRFQNDSTDQFNDSQTQIQNFLNDPNFGKWQKQLQEQFNYFNQLMPQFKNEEQRKEW